jgi:hypothetical protein
MGAPNLIIEILSPGNSRKEMNEKFEIYEENGTQGYWVVFPNFQTIQVYWLNEEGKYVDLLIWLLLPWGCVDYADCCLVWRFRSRKCLRSEGTQCRW